MAANVTFNYKTGNLVSEKYVSAETNYECSCGENLSLSLDWPQDVIVNGKVNLNKDCPKCGEKISLPSGKYSVKDGFLIKE